MLELLGTFLGNTSHFSHRQVLGRVNGHLISACCSLLLAQLRFSLRRVLVLGRQIQRSRVSTLYYVHGSRNGRCESLIRYAPCYNSLALHTLSKLSDERGFHLRVVENHAHELLRRDVRWDLILLYRFAFLFLETLHVGLLLMNARLGALIFF